MQQIAKEDVSKLNNLYEKDFYAWVTATAERIRQGRIDEVNLRHIAEELEDMGRSEKREMASRSRKLAAHLLKWGLQPEHRSSSWRGTIVEQRSELESLFETNPSLRPLAQETFEKEYRRAVTEASAETSLPKERFPQSCPFTVEQALDENYWPDYS